MRLLSSGLVVVAVALTAAGEPGAQAAEPLAARVRYEVRLANQVLGDAELELGAVRQGEGGRAVRSARLSASARQRPMAVDMATVLDAQKLDALRSKVRREKNHQVDELEVRFQGSHLLVTKTALGKATRSHLAAPAGTTDLPGWLFWLQGQDLAPGTTADRTLYTGTKLLKANARSIREETVRTPLGTHPAMRIETIVGSGPALPGEPPEPPKDEIFRFTVWLSRDAFRSPLKVEVPLGSLGVLVIEASRRTAD